MVRTIQTTRINTNYIPPPRQVPVYPVVVEEIPVDLPRIRVENGVILVDSLEEFLPTPTPLAKSLAFVARSLASAPPAPAVQAPAPGGDDPDDSGDDDEDDEEEEEEDEENINEEANEEQEDHYVGLWPVTEHYTSMFETGHFPNLLQDVLHALGTYVWPLYETRQVYEPPRACYYITRIHVRVMDAGDRGFRTMSAHESLTPLSTYAALVSDAARRTLWSLSHTYRQQLHNTKYMHPPLHIRGEIQTSIVLGGAGEDRLNTLDGVVAGLNTDLDSATLDLSRAQLELEDAHARIAALEAQFDGRNPLNSSPCHGVIPSP
jgi:ribosomal protein L12E/L44/L45/RPP1/RPP2